MSSPAQLRSDNRKTQKYFSQTRTRCISESKHFLRLNHLNVYCADIRFEFLRLCSYGKFYFLFFRNFSNGLVWRLAGSPVQLVTTGL